MSRMREVVQVVAKALVDQPDMVEVTEIDGPDESYVWQTSPLRLTDGEQR